MKKTISLFSLVVCALFVCVNINLNAQETKAATDIIEFKDENFKSAILSAVDTDSDGEITFKEMEEVTTIDVSSHDEITDITEIKYATNIETFWLYGNVKVTDISPVSELKVIDSLRIINTIGERSTLTDISPVANMTNLKILGFGGQSISDLTPLSNLINLTQLTLNENYITDLSPIAELDKVILVSFTRNQVSDITPIATMNAVSVVIMTDNIVSDLTPLKGKVRLQDILAEDNKISNISALNGLPRLYDVRLQGQQLVNDEELMIFAKDITEETVSGTVVNKVGETVNVYFDNLTADEKQFTTETEFGFYDDTGIVPFSGTITRDVYIIDEITTSIDEYTYEESSASTRQTSSEPTSEELIEIYGAKADDRDVLNVDATAVDFGTSGDYDLRFYSDLGSEKTVKLTVVVNDTSEPSEVISDVTSDDNSDVPSEDNSDTNSAVNPESEESTDVDESSDDKSDTLTPSEEESESTVTPIANTGQNTFLLINIIVVLGLVVVFGKYTFSRKVN